MTTDADRLGYLRMHARALIYEAARTDGAETDERDIENIAALRLVYGEVLRRKWPANLADEARALMEEIDRSVDEVMVARGWSDMEGVDPEFLVLSWLRRRGPRRFYSHNMAPRAG